MCMHVKIADVWAQAILFCVHVCRQMCECWRAQPGLLALVAFTAAGLSAWLLFTLLRWPVEGDAEGHQGLGPTGRLGGSRRLRLCLLCHSSLPVNDGSIPAQCQLLTALGY